MISNLPDRQPVAMPTVTAALLGVFALLPGAGIAAASPAMPSPMAESTGAQSEPARPSGETHLTDCLQQSWIHSHEEDTAEATVYRPADYPFPPSRGRTGYEFLPGGVLINHGIGPADGPTLAHGIWALLPEGRVTVDADEPGAHVSETLQILDCTADRLMVAR